jgi:spermidine synthase
VNVPSFGDWGFIMASQRPLDLKQLDLIDQTQFVSDQVTESMTVFAKDRGFVAMPSSTIDHPLVLNHYLKGFKEWD